MLMIQNHQRLQLIGISHTPKWDDMKDDIVSFQQATMRWRPTGMQRGRNYKNT
jgi:hypothetical protein